MKIAIGVDVGGTKIRGGLVREDGRILHSEELPTEAGQGGRTVVKRIVSLIDRLGPLHACGIGLGVTGQIGRGGQILSATSIFPDWAGIALQDELAHRYPLPVRVINDVQAMALGEQRYGLGKGIADFVCLALGTGVGGAIVSDGKLLRGANGAAGEMGHMLLRPKGRPCPCGKHGCLEAYVSGNALAMRYLETNGLRKKASAILQEAASGDLAALAISKEFLSDLATGIVTIATLLNPQSVIIGGGIAFCLPPFHSELLRLVTSQLSVAAAHEFSVKISELKDDSMVLGAAGMHFS